MKTSQGIHSALRSSHQYTVLPFLAPATLHTPLNTAARCIWRGVRSHNAAFSRCFVASAANRDTPAEAAQRADPPAQADSQKSDGPNLNGLDPWSKALEAEMLGNFVDDANSKNDLLRERTSGYWDRKQRPLLRDEYISTHRRRIDDAANKKITQRMDSIITSLPKSRKSFGSSLGSPASSVEVAPRAGDPAATAIKYQAPEVDLRINPYLGRSVPVKPDIGLAVALRSLNRKLRENNVRGDLNRQRFHERPGLKRKRLKSERWRKRFKEGFKAMIAQVQEMRKKGW